MPSVDKSLMSRLQRLNQEMEESPEVAFKDVRKEVKFSESDEIEEITEEGLNNNTADSGVQTVVSKNSLLTLIYI